MSLRAIKKRENNQLNTPFNNNNNNYNNNNNATGANRPSLFKKLNSSPNYYLQNPQHQHSLQQYQRIPRTSGAPTLNSSPEATVLGSFHNLQKQRTLLGRLTRSNPELLRHSSDTVGRLTTACCLIRTKSESDVSTLLSNCIGNNTDTGAVGIGLLGAKSEVCLQTISSHNYTTSSSSSQHHQKSQKMISGARSHRDLTKSSYGAPSDYHEDNTGSTRYNSRRMSECSLTTNTNSNYSQRTSGMSTSALTLSSSDATEPNAVVRVPIIGYEVMEERARFTVYKLRVENPLSNDCWLVLRRYTDFVRLNTKLKQTFPNFTLMLPRKKIFGDNFNSVFLDNRVQGLQMFVNSIMAKEELRTCKLVREFFCLDEPPTYSESMEECRAIFEAQEETIAHLKFQINNKNDLILSLQQKLREELLEKEQLKESLRDLSAKCSTTSK